MAEPRRRILIVGGGTAGWLSAAFLAKALHLAEREAGQLDITLLESPDLQPIGVGEGAFPTLRATLQFLGIDEAHFVRETSATLKQGILFRDWLEPGHRYFHPFEAPHGAEGLKLVPYWLLQDAARRPPFAEAVSLQPRVMAAHRAPKRAIEAPFAAPLNYAYHFDALKFAGLLAAHAQGLGVRRVAATVDAVALDGQGRIAHLDTLQQGRFTADLYIDCSGLRAELIGRLPGADFKPVSDLLFTDRALSCRVAEDADRPLPSCTLATAHEAGWTWDIALDGARGVGCVYSSAHLGDERAEALMRAYLGPGHADTPLRRITFQAGWRERQWVGNCVAIGLSAGFLEPLESTGLVMIEAAVGMLAELMPHAGPIDAPARRFNALMTARFNNVVGFLKLHYALSRRTEPFWRDNASAASMPAPLAELLAQWRLRPPGRFDFELDTETFTYFNYQYILYGMGFHTDLDAARADFPRTEAAARLFARIARHGERAVGELPDHRALLRHLQAASQR